MYFLWPTSVICVISVHCNWTMEQLVLSTRFDRNTKNGTASSKNHISFDMQETEGMTWSTRWSDITVLLQNEKSQTTTHAGKGFLCCSIACLKLQTPKTIMSHDNSPKVGDGNLSKQSESIICTNNYTKQYNKL